MFASVMSQIERILSKTADYYDDCQNASSFDTKTSLIFEK